MIPVIKLTVLVLLAGLFALLAHADLTRRRLPNRWIAYYALLFPFYAWGMEMGWMQLIGHGVTALTTFLLLLPLFIRGGIGGGDVKLGTVVMLWAGVSSLASVLVVVSLAGALLGMAGWLTDKFCSSQTASETAWRTALSARRGVPYGVALVCGGITALAEQYGWIPT
ncbi:prepilin peptidase CpaA|uniref:Prepilin peptidase CpaA n=2 Tax=Brenneria salicis TaxID=55214 RepID=A0A366I6T7_9GAMM|nr:prepilin peptidase CpaA [Brenneria salicis ATCC 15712 = DSM 30166]RBP63730.1 prepilin peptidase CpaA [Brenneria salicis ATCC 15712 = DSM 30166]